MPGPEVGNNRSVKQRNNQGAVRKHRVESGQTRRQGTEIVHPKSTYLQVTVGMPPVVRSPPRADTWKGFRIRGGFGRLPIHNRARSIGIDMGWVMKRLNKISRPFAIVRNTPLRTRNMFLK